MSHFNQSPSGVNPSRFRSAGDMAANDPDGFAAEFLEDPNERPAAWSSQPTPAEIEQMALQAAPAATIAPVATVTVPEAALHEYQLANARFRGFIEAVLVELQRGRDIDYRPALVEHLRAELAEVNREAEEWLAAKFLVEHMPRPAA